MNIFRYCLYFQQVEGLIILAILRQGYYICICLLKAGFAPQVVLGLDPLSESPLRLGAVSESPLAVGHRTRKPQRVGDAVSPVTFLHGTNHSPQKVRSITYFKNLCDDTARFADIGIFGRNRRTARTAGCIARGWAGLSRNRLGNNQ